MFVSTLVCSLTCIRDECPAMEIHLSANGDTDESGARVTVEGRLYPHEINNGNSVRPHALRADESATKLSSLNEDRCNIGVCL